MSRGGRGWGGRGGGRGRGGFMPGDRGGMGSKDMYDALKQPNKYAGMLYPPLDQVARLDRPDMFEEDIMRYTMQMEDMLLHGPHGIASGSGSGGRGAPAAPPWRLANPRKTVTIEIEQWSDRFDPQSSLGGGLGGGGGNGSVAGGRGGIDPETMYMNPTFFPESLWKEYFESSSGLSGGGRGKGKSGAQGGKKRKRPLRGEDGFEQDDGDSDGDGKPDVEDEVGDNPSQSEDSDFDFDDDGTDHQDYDHNYFDNGEGDDDSGGDDDDGGGGDD